MKVRVTVGCAGHSFNFQHGQEVDAEEFANRVGNGWRNLCEPVAEAEVETADDPVVETMARRPRRRGKV